MGNLCLHVSAEEKPAAITEASPAMQQATVAIVHKPQDAMSFTAEHGTAATGHTLTDTQGTAAADAHGMTDTDHGLTDTDCGPAAGSAPECLLTDTPTASTSNTSGLAG